MLPYTATPPLHQVRPGLMQYEVLEGMPFATCAHWLLERQLFNIQDTKFSWPTMFYNLIHPL